VPKQRGIGQTIAISKGGRSEVNLKISSWRQWESGNHVMYRFQAKKPRP